MRALVFVVASAFLLPACGLTDAVLFPEQSDPDDEPFIDDEFEPPVGEGEGEPPNPPDGMPICTPDEIIFVPDFTEQPNQTMQGRTGTQCAMNLPNATCSQLTTGPSPYQLLDLFSAEGGQVRIQAVWDGYDGYLALYEADAFNPSVPLAGCVAANDDEAGDTATSAMTITLAAGESRLLVASTFGGTAGGAYTLIMSAGP